MPPPCSFSVPLAGFLSLGDLSSYLSACSCWYAEKAGAHTARIKSSLPLLAGQIAELCRSPFGEADALRLIKASFSSGLLPFAAHFPRFIRKACAAGRLVLADFLWSASQDSGFHSLETAADAMEAACISGQLEAVRWLWARGLTLDHIRRGRRKLLQQAAAWAPLEITAWLWSRGLELEDMRYGSLGSACRRGRTDVVMWLLGHAADLSGASSQNKASRFWPQARSESFRHLLYYAFESACEAGELETAQKVWDAGLTLADLRQNQSYVLHRACWWDGRHDRKTASWLRRIGVRLVDTGAAKTMLMAALERGVESVSLWMWEELGASHLASALAWPALREAASGCPPSVLVSIAASKCVGPHSLRALFLAECAGKARPSSLSAVLAALQSSDRTLVGKDLFAEAGRLTRGRAAAAWLRRAASDLGLSARARAHPYCRV
jgi:hypothetical protein